MSDFRSLFLECLSTDNTVSRVCPETSERKGNVKLTLSYNLTIKHQVQDPKALAIGHENPRRSRR